MQLLLASWRNHRGSSPPPRRIIIFVFLLFIMMPTDLQVAGMDSMSSIAVAYGADGPVFCGLSSDGTDLVACYGSDASIVYGAPVQSRFAGIAAGDGFACGLLLESGQPYCWGSNPYVPMGVPQPILEGAAYSALSAGDHHICALRRRSSSPASSSSLVDCWGYNMTASHIFTGGVAALTAGSVFNCALFAGNRTAACWGDDTGSGVMALQPPPETRFRSISAGGFHVCGILESSSRVMCWGRSLDSAPASPMVMVVGGRFHACGIRSSDGEVECWGFAANQSVPPPRQARMLVLAAGDYFTCGVSVSAAAAGRRRLQPVCWGSGGPWSVPLAVSPGVCAAEACSPGYYDYAAHVGSAVKLCSSRSTSSRVCLPCGAGCPPAPETTTESLPPCCNAAAAAADRSKVINRTKGGRILATQLPIFVAELVFALVLVVSVSSMAVFFVRHRLRNCKCTSDDRRRQAPSTKTTILRRQQHVVTSLCKDSSSIATIKVRPAELEDLKINRRARVFSYDELEKATEGFKEESQVGKGSFSRVFRGVLEDGTVVAVKRAMILSSSSSGAAAGEAPKNSKEFHTELDLLSRLNHAHLLNLLGYCEEGGERLLVYEFMAQGSLHQHLHGKEPSLKTKLDWVRRVTIAVQAARGIEYLHGYACPPVIHRDIKSSNILIDEENNARVADFGLSLLGPADSGSPLSELPAGTLGYLDPEYYRLHYLTTKSDVYSFGVLLLEILSGRKAIDMDLYEEGNIVEWAAPLIKCGDVAAVLDPVLEPPRDMAAVEKIAGVAYKCVKMRGKDRPSMEKVTTALERALAMLMSNGGGEPILPTEVVLGSSRMHGKASQASASSNRSCSAAEEPATMDGEQRLEFRAPSWITFPSMASSSQRRASMSDGDMEGRVVAMSLPPSVSGGGAGAAALDGLEEEIRPASPQQDMFLQHNF